MIVVKEVAHVEEASVPTEQESRNYYILIVDKDVDDRFQISMMLQRFGQNICTASLASEAIDFMHVAPPAIIVAEALAGIDLVSRLKKDARFSNIPIITLTKVPDLDIDFRLRKGGFAACLTMPLNAEKFFEAIQSALKKNVRKNIRIQTCLLARLDRAEEGIVSVLSESGMFFPTEEARPLNTVVPVILEIGDRTINLEAVVLYGVTSDTSPFKEPGMGMKFVKISDEDRAFIKS